MRIITLIIAVACLIGCADPAFQQYIQNRQAAINAMPNGAAKYIAQERLDQQILADKQRQNQQAANAAAAIALGAAAGLAAGSAAAHEAQDRETVIIPAAGLGLQVPSWQPTNGTPLWHREEYQAPKTYYTKPTWGGWVTTEQP